MNQSPSPQSDSPATRLLEFVRQARNRAQNGTQQREAWASLIGCPATDTLAILQGYGEVLRLVDHCKRLAKESMQDATLYLEVLAEIEGGLANFSLFNNANFGMIANQWNDAVLRSMQFVEQHLRGLDPRSRVPSTELAEMMTQLTSYENAITQSKIDNRLKAVILENVMAIRRALQAYNLVGADYLERVVAKGTGTLALYKDLFEQEKQSSDYWSLLQKSAKVISIARSGVALLTEGTKLAIMVGKLAASHP